MASLGSTLGPLVGPLFFLGLAVAGLVRWRRSQLPIPRMVHVIAAVGLAAGAWMTWMDASGGELRWGHAITLIVLMPLIVYVAFFAFSKALLGQRRRARALAIPRDRLAYEVHVDTEEPAAHDVRSELSLADARDLVLHATRSARAVILVAAYAPDFALGDVQLWFSGDRALVRVSDDRDHHAETPDARALDEGELTFADESGQPFAAPLRSTVTREQAAEAFIHWLETGSPDERLTWRS